MKHTQESGTPGEETGERNTRAAWLAWSMCGLTLTLVACALALAALNRGDVQEVTFPFVITVSAVVGGLVASRRPKNPVGWYFLSRPPVLPSLGSRTGTRPTGSSPHQVRCREHELYSGS
jgi:FtsH-binding integral membrane protein